MVYLNEPTGQPLYRSPLLIGSDQVADVGTLTLSGPSGGQKLLGLVTDAMPENRPPQADPLDIRDTVDWLEPVLLLDGGKLRGHVEQAAARVVQAWNGWKVDAGQVAPLETHWDEARERQQRFAFDVATENRPVTLSIERNIADADRWLLLHLWQATERTRGRAAGNPDRRPADRAGRRASP